MTSSPKLLFVVTEDWFFVSHFLSVASAAQEAGFVVTVSVRVRNPALQRLGVIQALEDRQPAMHR